MRKNRVVIWIWKVIVWVVGTLGLNVCFYSVVFDNPVNTQPSVIPWEYQPMVSFFVAGLMMFYFVFGRKKNTKDLVNKTIEIEDQQEKE